MGMAVAVALVGTELLQVWLSRPQCRIRLRLAQAGRQALPEVIPYLVQLLQQQEATVAALVLEQAQLAGLVAVVRVLTAWQTALVVLEREAKVLLVALARRLVLLLLAAAVLLP